MRASLCASLCAFIVRFIVRAMGVVPQHSLHNGARPSLRNEAAQYKIIVRPARHPGRAYIGRSKVCMAQWVLSLCDGFDISFRGLHRFMVVEM